MEQTGLSCMDQTGLLWIAGLGSILPGVDRFLFHKNPGYVDVGVCEHVAVEIRPQRYNKKGHHPYTLYDTDRIRPN